ncbi:MAG: thiolase family protein [Syntrophales bacterium]
MDKKNEVVIISTVRTPFSRFGGVLRNMHSMDIAVFAIKECLKRSKLRGEDLDELYYGMCIQSEAALESNVNARQALLRAGLPPSLVSLTIDRACCSSLSAVQLGFRSILLDEARICMAIGAENMSNTPLVVNGLRWGRGLLPPVIKDHLNPITYTGFNFLAKDAGDVAIRHGITREMQDAWALRSQQRYQEALKNGKFSDEMMAMELPGGKKGPVIFDRDEFPKADTTMDGLAKLKPVYGSPTVTAGNAPGLDAGASALIIMKRSEAERRGIKPLATLLTVQSIAVQPDGIAEAPAPAIRKALAKSGLQLKDMNLIEINEAFAAMPLVATRILSEGDDAKWKELQDKTNVNGGAIAIGHPVGASGARILMTMMYELRRRGGGKGVCAICGGLAQGDAAVIRVD